MLPEHYVKARSQFNAIQRRKELTKVESYKNAVDRCGIRINDKVLYRGVSYTFLGVTAQGMVKIQPVSIGNIISVNPSGVFFNGKPIYEWAPI